MNALRSTAYAAVLARDFILAGGFWWTYQTIYAKRNKPLNGSVPGWSHRRVREVGLGVDESYSNRAEGPGAQSSGPPTATTQDPISSEPTPAVAPRAAALDRILEQHRSAHPNIWAPLAGLLQEGNGPGYLERALRTLAEAYDKGRRTPDQAVIKSLLLIAIEVDFLRTAIDMLRRLDQPTAFLVPIALRIAESTRVNRLALSTRRLSEWLTALKDRWNVCAGDSLTDEERFALHEVLLGRHATIRGTLRPRAAELLLKRVFNPDALVPADYFDVIEQQEDAFRPGPDLIPPRDLGGFVARHQGYPMGSPLVVSLVTLPSGTSVITRGLHTGLRGSFRPDLNLAAEFDILITQRNRWFRWRRGSSSNHVPWGENAFITLRNELVELARENGAKWIMLATEPRLSALPWQHLFAYSAGYSKLRDSPLLVTIVPNMGWAPLLDRQPYDGLPALVELVCRSNDPVIERGRLVLDQLKAVHPTPPFNLGVILGHGDWPENAGRLPEIIVSNKKLDAEDWLDVATCQVIVLHSCWSGTTAAEATQWAEGALVVHLLGPCRAVVAPVGEIPVVAMKAMHREFMVREPSGTLGERYLRALVAEPSVSLYTIFGLGSVPPFAV